MQGLAQMQGIAQMQGLAQLQGLSTKQLTSQQTMQSLNLQSLQLTKTAQMSNLAKISGLNLKLTIPPAILGLSMPRFGRKTSKFLKGKMFSSPFYFEKTNPLVSGAQLKQLYTGFGTIVLGTKKKRRRRKG